jgi:hypothetical protein
MLRLLALFFTLGIALGIYLGIGDAPDVAPPPVAESVSVNATAP